MDISGPIVDSAIEILIRLLKRARRSDNTSAFGKDITIAREYENTARATTQLIEICSWLGILSNVRRDLKELVFSLEQRSVIDRNIMPIQPSRMKSILLFGGFQEETMKAALDMITKDIGNYRDDLYSVQHLSYIDLLGTVLHLRIKHPENAPLPISQELSDKIKNQHGSEIDELKNLILQVDLKKRVGLQELSFILRLLIINRCTEETGIKTCVISYCRYLEDKIYEKAKNKYLDRYEEWIFPQIAYAYTILFWCARKKWLKLTENEYTGIWFKACSEYLKELSNPYHASLFLKPIIAGQKEGFLRQYTEKSYEALLKIQDMQKEIEEQSLKSVIIDALRESISVDCDSPKRLTAGWSRAAVYRVKPLIELPADNITSYRKDYVVKLGTQEAILDAARIYSLVPDKAKELFVRTNQKLYGGTVGHEGLHFIVMEYLERFEEYITFVNRLMPMDMSMAFDIANLKKVTETCLRLISKLHKIPVADIVSLSPRKSLKVKIAEFYSYESILSLKLQDFTNIISDGVKLETCIGQIKLMPCNTIIGRLINLPKSFAVVSEGARKNDRFVLIHGDCHGNNIMISDNFRQAMFIDIADVHIDDYLEDYAAFLAHICFSANLESASDYGLLPNFPKTRMGESAESLESLYKEKRAGLSIIWQLTIDQINQFASSISDSSAIPRFLLLLGRRLLFVASKSRSAIKAYILYIQAIYILQYVSVNLKNVGRNPIDIIIPPGDSLKIMSAGPESKVYNEDASIKR